ncbi:HAD family hydrolase [Bacillus timonensis]|nr:HAD family hydrolase [Bacillus timonensis]
MKWDIICFDLDNTLFNYEETFNKSALYCFKNLIDRNNFQIPYSELFREFKSRCDKYWWEYETGEISQREYRRKRFIHSLEAFGIDSSINAADEFQKKIEQNLTNFIVPYNGVKLLLHDLLRLNVKIGIITNGKSSIQSKKLSALKIKHYFNKQHIIISEEVGYSKPETIIFDYTKDKFGSEDKMCLYIGDSWEQDIVGARKANWDAIFLNTRKQKPTTSHSIISICYTIQDLHRKLIFSN